ncbi:hypothetical protein GCM10027258_10120 [Amycolatopsis stemonae]
MLTSEATSAGVPDERVVPGQDKTAQCLDNTAKGFPMSWLVLVLSGILETVWAAALKGFFRPASVVTFVVALVLSMSGLAYALREIPLGTGYAI